LWHYARCITKKVEWHYAIKYIIMKAKLLKKLRANYVIMKRNTEYQLVTLDGRFNDSGWDSLVSCIRRRREHILYDALKYKTAKSVVKRS